MVAGNMSGKSGRVERVGFDLDARTLKHIVRFARADGVELDVMLRLLLQRGIASRRVRDRLREIAGEGSTDREKILKLTVDLMDVHSACASLHFQNHQLVQDLRVLEMNLGGARGANENLQLSLARLRVELDRLRAQEGTKQ